jgi:asparagine synthase (glutamine-hydrolysing)
MCGIAGEITTDGSSADVRAVAAMSTRLAERGPDGAGEWSDGRVALAHRRLSIIDLSEGGAQPMVDPRHDLVVVFNGCIYNHAALRDELRSDYGFTSASDTEVILAAYVRWGQDLVDHLVGMFAFVLVDRARDRVVIARDRLGIKPLYLSRLPGRIRFASTLPALVAGGGVDTALDPVALHHYLSWHSIVPAPRSILRGVEKLPAATVRVIDASGREHDRVYWQPEYVRDPARADWDARDWQDALHDGLRTAVRRRLVADVDVGVLLSGGLDSSLIVALLAEEGRERIPTFSIGFGDVGDERGDEFEYSDAIARRFDTDHHRIRIPDDELREAVPAAIGAMTEPMATQDVTAFFLLAQRVAREVRVVQCGQGSDEVFAGYRYHQPAATAAREDAAEVFSDAFVDRPHAEVQAMLTPDHRVPDDASARLLQADVDRPGAETALDAVLRLDTNRLMIDDPVKRLDSMTMAWALEARVPFLDHDLVELAAACPPQLKAAQGGKGVLKDLGRRLLPHEVIDRPKGYFPVPGLRHLDDGMRTLVRDALHAPEARERAIFDPGVVDRLLAEPNARHTRVGGNVLWQVGLLELWLQHHGVG